MARKRIKKARRADFSDHAYLQLMYDYVVSQGGNTRDARFIDGDEFETGYVEYWTLENDTEYNYRMRAEANERAKKAEEKERIEKYELEEYLRLKKKFGDS